MVIIYAKIQELSKSSSQHNHTQANANTDTELRHCLIQLGQKQDRIMNKKEIHMGEGVGGEGGEERERDTHTHRQTDRERARERASKRERERESKRARERDSYPSNQFQLQESSYSRPVVIWSSLLNNLLLPKWSGTIYSFPISDHLLQS